MALQHIDGTNHTSHRVKQLILLEAIQKELPETIFVMEEGREIINQGQVRITKPKIGSGILYLFSDIIILASKGKKVNTPILQTQVRI